jgi:hypothetical protein
VRLDTNPEEKFGKTKSEMEGYRQAGRLNGSNKLQNLMQEEEKRREEKRREEKRREEKRREEKRREEKRKEKRRELTIKHTE